MLLCFTEDLQLIVWGNHTVTHTQEALLLIEQECSRLGLKISPAKTKTVAICFEAMARHLLLEGPEIEWIQLYRCLGIWLDENLNFLKQLERVRQKAKYRHYVMRSLTWSVSVENTKVLRTFGLTVIRSLMDHSASALLALTPTQF